MSGNPSKPSLLFPSSTHHAGPHLRPSISVIGNNACLSLVFCPMAIISVVSRALSISEILHVVCSSLDTKSLFHCALVCKAWLPVTLDLLWRDMNSAIDVFSALCPMSYEQKDKDGDAASRLMLGLRIYRSTRAALRRKA
jgi:hypothetical protein